MDGFGQVVVGIRAFGQCGCRRLWLPPNRRVQAVPRSAPADKLPYSVSAYSRADGKILWTVPLSGQPLMDGLSVARNGSVIVPSSTEVSCVSPRNSQSDTYVELGGNATSNRGRFRRIHFVHLSPRSLDTPMLIRSLGCLVVLFALLCRAFDGPGTSHAQLRRPRASRIDELERMADPPCQGRDCAQWSSYDRASKYDEKTGKYIDWGANEDGKGIIRKEGTQVVMAEMEGPGCIWRIWSAGARRRTRQDLPRRSSHADDRPSLPRLLYRQDSPIQLPDAFLRPRKAGSLRAEFVHADSVSEVVQSRRRRRLGQLLSLRIRHISQGHGCADLHCRPGRGERRRVAESKRLLPRPSRRDPAGERPGQDTLRGSRRSSPDQPFAWPSLPGRGRSPV